MTLGKPGVMLALLLTGAASLVSAQVKTGTDSSAENAFATASRSTAAWELRRDMRKLWTDHVVWTRDYIIAAVRGSPDQQAAANRLMKNQEDLGKAVGEYYGVDAATKLTDLLKEHITIAVDVVKAAKAKNDRGVAAADARWQQNAEAIAQMLSEANPNWSKETLTDLLKKHLATTTDEVKARLARDWDADVKAWDATYEHILKMSDALSDGIIKQHSNKFVEGSDAGR